MLIDILEFISITYIVTASTIIGQSSVRWSVWIVAIECMGDESTTQGLFTKSRIVSIHTLDSNSRLVMTYDGFTASNIREGYHLL